MGERERERETFLLYRFRKVGMAPDKALQKKILTFGRVSSFQTRLSTKCDVWLVLDSLQFDALVATLPLADGGEEAQLKRIAELQAENDTVGQELQRQLEAAEEELKQVLELFSQAADNCLNLKKPDYKIRELIFSLELDGGIPDPVVPANLLKFHEREIV